ncbi:MAG: Ig-like domain-containing protein [Cytophagaceae bacterium]|jgi:hypothetical protein|nr:Ig-like domain-containing protein [Cytophagaceae bacterium]
MLTELVLDFNKTLSRKAKFTLLLIYTGTLLLGLYHFNSSLTLDNYISKYKSSSPSQLCYVSLANTEIFESNSSSVPSRPIGPTTAAGLPKWSNPTTWKGGKVPTVGSIVYIRSNSAVLLDQDIDLSSVHIEGTLVIDYSKNINIATEVLMVMNKTGYFEMGTPKFRYTRRATITLKGADVSKFESDSYKSIMAMNEAEISIHGELRSSWTVLNATAPAGSRVISILAPMNWRVGDEIMITTTGIETERVDPISNKVVGGKDFTYTETEIRKITSISNDRKTITLNTPLTYKHFGKLQSFSNQKQQWILDERAEVGLLSRNIKIQGDTSSLTSKQGGHIMVMRTSKVNLDGIELSSMGQEGRLGRYPFHWHLAGDVKGQYFKNSIVKNCFNRAVTIHGTDASVVDSNVIYNTIGHGIFLEDGNEVGNRIHYNLVSVIKQPTKNPAKNLLPSDILFQGNRVQGPAGIWISNPLNVITFNAVSSTGTGLWNAYTLTPGGDAINYKPKIPFLPITNMDNNRAHACYVGLMFDFVDTKDRKDIKAASYYRSGQIVRNFTGFKNYRSIWYRGVTPLNFSNFTIGDDEGRGSFISTTVGLFTNGLVVGRSENITGPKKESYATSMYDGVETIRNCHFVNLNGNQNVFLIFGGGVKNLPHYTENVSFDSCTIFNPSLDNHFSPSVSFVEDLDGTLTGNKGWWMTTDHPFIIDEINFPRLQMGYNGRKTQYSFGRLGVTWGDDESRKATLYYEHADGHIAHTKPAGPRSDIPLIIDGGKRDYTIRFCDKIPNNLSLDWSQAKPGEEVFFKIIGMPEELNVISNEITKLSNKEAVKSSTSSSYTFINGEMFFHIITPEDGHLNFRLTNKSGSEALIAVEGRSRPFKSNPSTNTIIQAEHFDYGGQNVAYYENVGSNILGNTGRDVFDIRPGEILGFSKINNTNFALVDFGIGQWVNYTVNIPRDGLYKLEANVSTQVSANQRLELFVDGISKGQLTIPRSSGVYTQIDLGNFSLTKGARIIRFKAITAFARIDWFKLSSGASLPTVNITNPTNNATITGPASVSLTANASDLDGTITKVEFYNGTTKLGEDVTRPFTFNWTNVPIGNFSITAHATDNSGNTSVSAVVNIKVIPPNKPPKITIVSPSNNSVFNAPHNLTIKLDVSDEDGVIRQVEFFNGTTKIGTDVRTPFEFQYNTIPVGTYNLTARATDNDGAISTSNIVIVTVQLVRDCAGIPGGEARIDTCGVCVGGSTNKVTLNTDGDNLPDCIDTDDDNDGLIDTIDCFPLDKTKGSSIIWYQDLDGDGKGNPNMSRSACSQPTGYVRDNTDQCPSDPLKILPGDCGCGNTEASCANQLPRVNFVRPLNLAIVEAGSTLNVTVSASDFDGTITSVSLYFDNRFVRNELLAPYTWGSNDILLQNISPGSHTLRAIATDNRAGIVETSISIIAKEKDCANVLNGSAYLDVCNTCVGGTSGRLTADFDNDRIPDCIDDDDDDDGVIDSEDCNPLEATITVKTTWYADLDGDGYGDINNPIMSCTQPIGFVEDNSDECPNKKNRQNAGDCGCDMPEDACFDCEGIPFGRSFVDSCSICVKTSLDACKQDCNRVWGGTAFLDSCKTCAGGNTNITPILDYINCMPTSTIIDSINYYWTIKPNPTTDVFNIVVDQSLSIVLINIQGQVLFVETIKDVITIGEDLPSGFYIIKFYNDLKLVGVEKIIKN